MTKTLCHHLLRKHTWCRDPILYRLILSYFIAHDDLASQHNITIMCRAIPHIMCSFPAIMCQTCDTFPHLRLVCILMHLCISLHFIAHHCRSIHPLSSQFLGMSHSNYYYIWLCLALYDYYFILDPYFTLLTYLECFQFASEPWKGAYVWLRVAMFVFTT